MHPAQPFRVYYWQPVGSAADTDTETGASLQWGISLLEGYPWEQVDPARPQAFADSLRQCGARYLISNGWKQGFAPLLQAARAMGVPMGLRIDSVLWQKSRVELMVRRVVLRKAYRHFSHFFSSGTVCDQFLQRMDIPRLQWQRWPYLVDGAFFAPQPAYTTAAQALRQQYGLDARPIVLGICKWNERENPLELAEAFVQLDPAQVQLVLIGDGPLRPRLEAWQQAHPRHRMVYPGYVPYVQLPHWYALARLFVHPAQYEPWGVSVQEALYAGCRVLASTRVGSALDLISSPGQGAIYPSGHAAALVDCLQQYLAPAAAALPAPTGAVPGFTYEDVYGLLMGAGLRRYLC